MNRAVVRIVGLLAGSYLALLVLGTVLGPVKIPLERWPAVLWGPADPGDFLLAQHRAVVWEFRLPQMVLAGLIGAALAGSGAALQASLANPLADPGLLGVTAGGALGAVLAFHLGLAEQQFLALPACSLLGALAASLLVYGLAFAHGRPSTAALLLLGVAVAGLASAVTTLVLMLLEEHRMVQALRWLSGASRDQTWEHVGLAGPGVLVGLAVLMSLHRRLDAMLLGEEHALAVGVPVTTTRLTVLSACAVAVGSATAAGGAISFVGLMVPHLLRPLVGPTMGRLLPASLAGGAAFLTACELASRALPTAAPVGVGVVTTALGGAFFLALLRSRMG